jgi:hypothetical protein
LSAYLGNKVLDWLKGNAFPSAPADIYLALFDGDPKGAGTEITELVNYTGRLVISLEALSGGTDVSVASDADVDFGNSLDDVDLSHVAVFDDPVAGNLLWAKALPGGPYVITTGMPVKFNAAAIVFNCGD